ncbi:MAG: FMN-binding protein [Aureispira sp.]
MSRSSILLFLIMPFFCLAQRQPKEIKEITNEGGTNSKNMLLQELLNKSEKELELMLIPCAFFKGKSYPIDGAINLSKANSILRGNFSTLVPYWKVKGSDQLILMMCGNGLWDRIYGYILIDPNSKLIENIVFGHRAETPGLGAEISKRKFEEKFIGLEIGQTHTFLVKKNAKEDKPYQIEGITGATITGDGVTEMFRKCIDVYAGLLKT